MTSNLQKAQKGDVMCVIDPNKTGYDKLKFLNYDDRMLKDVVNGIGKAIDDTNQTVKLQADEIEQLKKENAELNLTLDKTLIEVKQLRQALENTLKGLMLR